jgi:hypothetical protein
MSKRSILSLVILLAAIVAFAAPTASAQTTYEIRNATVISAWENTVVYRNEKGETRQIELPPGFKVNVDGKDVPVSELKPGMKVSATVKTTTAPVVVQTTTLKDAKVIKNEGGLLYVREADGIHSYNIPEGFRFDIGGAKVRTVDLQQGQHLNATIVHTARGTHTEQQVVAAAASDEAARAAAAKAAADKAAADRAAAERAAAERAAADTAAADAKARADAEAAAAKAAADAAAAQEAMAQSLPKTASPVPLAGALGALCVGLGAALTLRRKLR